MAGIQASGVGSGLDIASLVSQLVAAEREPLKARIDRREATATVELSAFAKLRSALAALRDALAPLRDEQLFAVRSAVSADEAVFTASASSSVSAATYDVEVVSLASAHKLASAAHAGGASSFVGSGTLSVSLGGESFEVELTAATGTLAGIRDAINAAAGNPGVTASIVNEVGGSRLVLTAQRTGAATVIGVTQSGGDGGLAALTFDAGQPLAGGLSQVTAAADALIRVDGFEHRSAGNTVSGVIDGLTLSLRQADPGVTHALTVANDTSAVASRIREFVSRYNAAAQVMRDLRKYDAATGAAGPLIGDAFLRGLESQLRRDVTDVLGRDANAGFGSLAQLGITTDANGLLQVDDSRLSAALSGGFDAVAALFGGATGIAARAYDRVDAALASGGSLTVRTEALNREMSSIGRDREALDRRMETIESRYQNQFNALDALLAQLQTSSDYLSQQLSMLQTSRARQSGQ